jgi:prepilin-type N-terminal cleavage/methylation domain-containing protein
MNRKRSQGGFTLIELLIVVAIIGIIDAILIPNLIDSLQKGKQKRTMGDMRNTGTCMMAWLTDQVGAGAAGSTVRTYDVSTLPTIAASDLLTSLYPLGGGNFFYCQEVPTVDGWGHRMSYYLNTANLLGANVMAIVAPARDNTFMGNVYTVGAYITTRYDNDIVWADGLFVYYPAGVQYAQAQAAP